MAPSIHPSSLCSSQRGPSYMSGCIWPSFVINAYVRLTSFLTARNKVIPLLQLSHEQDAAQALRFNTRIFGSQGNVRLLVPYETVANGRRWLLLEMWLRLKNQLYGFSLMNYFIVNLHHHMWLVAILVESTALKSQDDTQLPEVTCVIHNSHMSISNRYNKYMYHIPKKHNTHICVQTQTFRCVEGTFRLLIMSQFVDTLPRYTAFSLLERFTQAHP